MEIYKKHRPQSFDEIIGNESTITSLKALIQENNVPHCILLSGPSGSGKTTVSRILKNHLQCSDTDFIECNCADNNGVDFGREIAQKMQFKPMYGNSRIWLLDEAHKMTSACANVLLKPFEDCPNHVYFILCTTEPEGLLNTIKTRATHFTFQSLNEKSLRKLLLKISRKEGLNISDEAIEQIILNSNGSARLALVLLDQIKSLNEEDFKKVIISIAEKENQGIELARALIYNKGWLEVKTILANLKEEPEKIRRGILGYCSSVLLSRDDKYDEQAFLVMLAFRDNFYNTGKAGLILASYDVIHASK